MRAHDDWNGRTAVCLTIVHVSDLHIGPADAAKVVARDDRPVPFWNAGVAGHDLIAERRLRAKLDQLTFDGETCLVFTGDLTADGCEDQFERGTQLLDELLPDRGGADWRQRSVMGNHDHWPPGWRVWHVSALGDAANPRSGTTINAHTSRLEAPGTSAVRFARVATDDEVLGPRGGSKRGRVLARGKFDREVQDLQDEIRRERCPPSEPIVLVMHHSPGFRAALWQKVTFVGLAPLEIVPSTIGLLSDALREAPIRVILSGHTHRPHVGWLNERRQEFARCRCLEACCGTTLQKPVEPVQNAVIEHAVACAKAVLDLQVPGLGDLLEGVLRERYGADPPTLPPTEHVFLVHRVVAASDDGGSLAWETDLYSRALGAGFRRREPPPDASQATAHLGWTEPPPTFGPFEL